MLVLSFDGRFLRSGIDSRVNRSLLSGRVDFPGKDVVVGPFTPVEFSLTEPAAGDTSVRRQTGLSVLVQVRSDGKMFGFKPIWISNPSYLLSDAFVPHRHYRPCVFSY